MLVLTTFYEHSVPLFIHLLRCLGAALRNVQLQREPLGYHSPSIWRPRGDPWAHCAFGNFHFCQLDLRPTLRLHLKIETQYVSPSKAEKVKLLSCQTRMSLWPSARILMPYLRARARTSSSICLYKSTDEFLFPPLTYYTCQNIRWCMRLSWPALVFKRVFTETISRQMLETCFASLFLCVAF